MKNLEAISIGIAGFLAIGYILRYVHLGYFGASMTMFVNQNRRSIRHWITRQATNQDNASMILTVQTFRNTIMVATFIGGAAFSNAFSQLNSSSHLPLDRKIVAIFISICLFASFLCWTQVIRACLRLAYILYAWNYEVDALGKNHEEPAEKREKRKKLRIAGAVQLGETFVFSIGYMYMSFAALIDFAYIWTFYADSDFVLSLL